MCVLILRHVSAYFYNDRARPLHATPGICEHQLLYMSPHTTTVSSYYYICVLYNDRARPLRAAPGMCYICVRKLLHMHPHTIMCPHTTTYASAYYYIYVSSYYYICVRILRTQDLSGIGFHDLTVPDDMWASLNVGRSSALVRSLLALLLQKYKY